MMFTIVKVCSLVCRAACSVRTSNENVWQTLVVESNTQKPLTDSSQLHPEIKSQIFSFSFNYQGTWPE